VRALVTAGQEREELFARQVFARQAEMYPQFSEYAQRTTRLIPVIALLPSG
jgi:hypothetical protein